MLPSNTASVLAFMGYADTDYDAVGLFDGSTALYWKSDRPRPTDAEIAAAALPAAQAAKRAAIKAAARQVILSRYPDWMQANLLARAVELVSVGDLSGPEWQQMQSIWGWIQAVRARSDLLEADVAACTTAEAVEGIVIGGWPD